MKLYDFQKKIVKEIIEAIKQGHKSILITSPCGSGKSYLIKYMMDNSKLNKILFCHRQELKQQLNELMPDLRIELPITAYNLLKKDEIGSEEFTINDEVHLALAKTWNHLMEHYKNKGSFVLGFSATPERLDNKSFGNLFTKLINGPSVKYLIENKFLSPFKYYCPQIPELDNISNAARQNPEANWSEYNEIFNKKGIFGNVVKNYTKFLDNKKTIVYCVNKEHARKTAKEFEKAGYKAESIDSDDNTKERAEIMERFRKGETKILCNCAIMSEGISINDLEGVILLRPTSSYALFIQQSMRGMRVDHKNPNKVAIIIDMVNNFRKHGLPDEEREFTLEGSKRKKTEEFNEEGDFLIRYCKNCFQPFETAKQCPYCSHIYELERREIENHKNIEIAEIKEYQKEQKRLTKKNFDKEFKNVWTEKQAMDLAIKYGYKPYFGIIKWRKGKGRFYK